MKIFASRMYNGTVRLIPSFPFHISISRNTTQSGGEPFVTITSISMQPMNRSQGSTTTPPGGLNVVPITSCPYISPCVRSFRRLIVLNITPIVITLLMLCSADVMKHHRSIMRMMESAVSPTRRRKLVKLRQHYTLLFVRREDARIRQE